jgi:DNA-binding transcriptional LysR family regulator
MAPSAGKSRCSKSTGVSLFVKDGRGLKLTDAGMRLRDASGEAFDRLRSVCAELTQSHVDAPFVLGCSGSLLARWFIPRLGRLKADCRICVCTCRPVKAIWTRAARAGCVAGVCRAAMAGGHAGVRTGQ